MRPNFLARPACLLSIFFLRRVPVRFRLGRLAPRWCISAPPVRGYLRFGAGGRKCFFFGTSQFFTTTPRFRPKTGGYEMKCRIHRVPAQENSRRAPARSAGFPDYPQTHIGHVEQFFKNWLRLVRESAVTRPESPPPASDSAESLPGTAPNAPDSVAFQAARCPIPVRWGILWPKVSRWNARFGGRGQSRPKNRSGNVWSLPPMFLSEP